MNTKNISTVLVLSGVIMGLVSQPAEAHQKYKNHHSYHRHKAFDTHHHTRQFPHSYGHVSFGLPRSYISITVGGERYHHHDGIYYRKERHGYVVTPAPIGGCLKRLPRGHVKIYIEGKPYYTYNGVYYARTSQGYAIVDEPRPVYAKWDKRRETQQGDDADAAFEVNIPNKRGGYTSVILQRSGTGFVGPQGEFYKEFPLVDDLKVIYGS